MILCGATTCRLSVSSGRLGPLPLLILRFLDDRHQPFGIVGLREDRRRTPAAHEVAQWFGRPGADFVHSPMLTLETFHAGIRACRTGPPLEYNLLADSRRARIVGHAIGPRTSSTLRPTEMPTVKIHLPVDPARESGWPRYGIIGSGSWPEHEAIRVPPVTRRSVTRALARLSPGLPCANLLSLRPPSVVALPFCSVFPSLRAHVFRTCALSSCALGSPATCAFTPPEAVDRAVLAWKTLVPSLSLFF